VLTAQGRYSTFVITLLPVALFWFLWVTNYDYVSQLFLPGITRGLFVAGIAGVVLGYLAMNRISAIDV
jgi:tight adherence protein B